MVRHAAWFVLALSALVAVSCRRPESARRTSSEPYHLIIDSAFSDEDVLAIELGAMAWMRAIGPDIGFTFERAPHGAMSSPGPYGITVTRIERMGEDDSDCPIEAVGCQQGNRIWLCRDWLNARHALQRVSAHEVGHVLGLANDFTKLPSVMSGSFYGMTDGPTVFDVRAVCAKIGCPARGMAATR
jgi:hypothetical protein